MFLFVTTFMRRRRLERELADLNARRAEIVSELAALPPPKPPKTTRSKGRLKI